MLHKDKALDAFFKENVVPNTKTFDSITDKIQYLLEHNYIEAFYREIPSEFLELFNLSRPKLPIQVSLQIL